MKMIYKIEKKKPKYIIEATNGNIKAYVTNLYLNGTNANEWTTNIKDDNIKIFDNIEDTVSIIQNCISINETWKYKIKIWILE